MTDSLRILAYAAPTFLLGAPLILLGVGLLRTVGEPRTKRAWDWGLTLTAAVLYALAFNVIFFIQELFLVIPKALTPGLRPILFHNNHDWAGDSPLAELFQGTGAVATVIVAIGCVAWLRRAPPRAQSVRVLAIWLGFHGFMQALPQVVLGAVFPPNDVGRAMTYLGLTPAVRIIAAVVAMAAIVGVCLWATRRLLEVTPERAETPRGRMAAIFKVGVLPAVIGLVLILPSRVPAGPEQLLIPPVAVALLCGLWLPGMAWGTTARLAAPTATGFARWPLLAWAIQLAVFQILLRPGVPFY